MTRHLSIGLTCLLVFGILGGCADEVILDNTGQACLSSDTQWPQGGQVFESGQSITVIVRFHECLSSSCDTNRQGSCSVEVSGDRIVITSQGSYTDESGAGTACTADCGIFDVACETGSIPDGTYTVVYGTEELELTIPDQTGDYCLPTRI